MRAVVLEAHGEPLAAEMGARETIDASAVDDVPARVRESTGGADVSVDALGSAETCRTAVASLVSGGTHVQVGLTGEDEPGEVSMPVDTIVQDGLTVVESRGMAPACYDDLFAMVAAGQVDPEALVTDTVSLSDVPDRVAAMNEYGTVGVEVVTEFS